MTGSTLRQALAFATAGWPVLPCLPGQKIPATAHGYRDATTDPTQITDWFSRHPDWNLAIATGTPGPDVLDIDVHGAALVVSQFTLYGDARKGRRPRESELADDEGGTLYGDARKGRRPSFIGAAGPEIAVPLYQAFIDAVKSHGVTVEACRFAADMQVELVDGARIHSVLAFRGREQAVASVLAGLPEHSARNVGPGEWLVVSGDPAQP